MDCLPGKFERCPMSRAFRRKFFMESSVFLSCVYQDALFPVMRIRDKRTGACPKACLFAEMAQTFLPLYEKAWYPAGKSELKRRMFFLLFRQDKT